MQVTSDLDQTVTLSNTTSSPANQKAANGGPSTSAGGVVAGRVTKRRSSKRANRRAVNVGPSTSAAPPSLKMVRPAREVVSKIYFYCKVFWFY